MNPQAKIEEHDASPLVTVVICAYNAGPFLRQSVRSALAQTYKNVEVLVIDDGSTDGSVEQLDDINDPRLRILRQENQGKSVALNRALDELNGDYYAILDADDESHPERIQRQVEALEADPSLAGVFTGHELLIDGKHVAPRFRPKSAEECRKDIDAFRMPTQDPTVMFRVAAVQGLEYDEELRIGQGYDYILRVGERSPLAVIGECLYSYRSHTRSVTRSDCERRLSMVSRVLQKAHERRGLEWNDVQRKQRTRDRDNNIATHFMESVIDLKHVGRLWPAFKVAFLSIRVRPLDLHNWKPLIYALTPRTWHPKLSPIPRWTQTPQQARSAS